MAAVSQKKRPKLLVVPHASVLVFRQPVHVLELYFATQGSRATSLSFHRWPASNTVRSVRRLVIRLLFIPSLIYNLVLERLLPSRRWWDQVEDHVLLGALPLPWIVDDITPAGAFIVDSLFRASDPGRNLNPGKIVAEADVESPAGVSSPVDDGVVPAVQRDRSTDPTP